MHYIPYGRQDITEEDIEAVVRTLKSDFITQGPQIEAFEKKLSEYTGAAFVSVMNSATSALHLACLALDVGPGDFVWTSPISFVASSNCALYCGAQVDFVDIDPDSFNMCAVKLEQKLELAKEENRLPKVVIPVHLCGLSCDMKAISRLSKKYGFKIIEDGSHAIGGKYNNVPIGGCEFSDIAVFSFHPVKIVTTGEGGACLTNQPDLSEKIKVLRSHGVTRQSTKMTERPHGPWYYQQVALGLNYRLTDIQASLGLSQLGRLDLYIEKRNRIARTYNELLSSLPVKLPKLYEDRLSAFHLYVVRVESAIRKRVFGLLREANIGVNIHYIPIHTQPYYQSMTFKNGPFEESVSYYLEAMSLPIFPTISEDDVRYVCTKLGESIDIARHEHFI